MQRRRRGGRPRIDRHNQRIADLAAAGLGKVIIHRELTAGGARVSVRTVGRRLAEIRQATISGSLTAYLSTYE